MWSGYSHLILDSWVPPLFYTPRWFNSNGYETLTDYIVPADVRTNVISGLFIPPSGGIIPAQWLLTSSLPSSGNLMQRFFETFVNEKEYMHPLLIATALSNQVFFDIAEQEFAWAVESLNPVTTLEVMTTSGLISITQAESDLELFYSGDWRWKQQNTLVLICGLDIQILSDTKDGSGWHFIDSLNKASTGGCLFMEHPITKNWFPIHPLNVRSDGYVGFNYPGTIRFRGSSSVAANLLPSVIVYVNGVQCVATRVSIYNTVDEKGQYAELLRRPGESNSDFGDTILTASWFKGQTTRKLRSHLSAALRTGTLTTVSASASSFSLPPFSTGYMVRNIQPWIYTSETLFVPVSGSTTQYYTRIVSGTGYGFLRGINTDFTDASGIIEFNAYTNNNIDRPIIDWKIPYFVQNGNTVTITNNFPENVPDLIVYFSSKVDVVPPSVEVLKQSFNNTSPCFKWQTFPNLTQEVISGLALFDF